MLVPMISAGSKSEVNWMREKSAAIEEEMAWQASSCSRWGMAGGCLSGARAAGEE